MENRLTRVGKFGKVHGLKGELKFKAIDGMEEFIHRAIESGDDFFLLKDSNVLPFQFATLRAYGKIAVLLEIEDVEDAKWFEHQEVLLEVEQAAEEPQGWQQLLDWQIFDTTTEQSIGTIAEIEEYPGHFMAIVQGTKGDILIPMVEALIVELDAESSIVSMSLPEGLLDL